MGDALFSIAFSGAAVENGDIDVRDLAPALLALGDLIQEANKVINGDSSSAVVKVRATDRGSFEISFVLQWAESAHAILDWIVGNKESIAAANQLLDLILKAGGVAAMPCGLLALLKKIGNRKPDKVEERDGNVYIFMGDTHFLTNKKVLGLAEHVAVRRHAQKFISILERNGIDSISSKVHGEDEVTLIKEDVGSFELPDLSEREVLYDGVRTMNLQIISLTFRDEGKWRFTDGLEPFTASIEDEKFLEKIHATEVVFGDGDYLVCQVRERQFRTSKGLKTERTIVEVLEHRPYPRQLKLF